MTFFEFNRKFPAEEAAIDYFYQVRYNNTLTCPHCGKTTKLYRTARPKVCICHNCENTFPPFADTIFKKSKTDMRMRFYAIHLIINDKKGISGCQLQRGLGVTYKTAWRMLKQIRVAMGNRDMKETFDVFVEIDETCAGGKPGKENKKLDENGNIIPSDKPKNKRGRGTKKTPVVGVKERNSKQVYAQVMLPNEEGKKLSGKQLLEAIEEVCKGKNMVMTDDYKSYKILDKKENRDKYTHLTANHSKGQYYAGNGVHTNGIENFWSVMKRGIIGIYHHISQKYLQRYVDEFCFRRNTRLDRNMFNVLLCQCVF